MNKLNEIDTAIMQHEEHMEAVHGGKLLAKELSTCKQCVMYANLIVSLYNDAPFMLRFLSKLLAWLHSPIQMYKMKIK